MFRTLSQLEIEYPDSPIVTQTARRMRPRAGQRLPDRELPNGQGWVHEQLSGPSHTLLSCEKPDNAPLIEGLVQRYYQGTIELRWLPASTWGGGILLVRPDGHIAYRGPADDTELQRYLQRYLTERLDTPAQQQLTPRDWITGITIEGQRDHGDRSDAGANEVIRS
ncbi:MAG TPA: hypothetical protein VIY28_09295 [Pseudonocardiaceae bacterium]